MLPANGSSIAAQSVGRNLAQLPFTLMPKPRTSFANTSDDASRSEFVLLPE